MFKTSQPQSADELRKQGKFEEAIPIYREKIKESQSTYPLRWLIYCLRKSGQLDAANQTGQEALKKFPNDKYIRSEMGWVIYDRELKPAKEAGNLGMAINSAKRSLELDPENSFLRNKVIQTVMKIGKSANNPDWKKMAEFAEKIDPTTLSDEKRKSLDGKLFMSEKEDWFVNASHAFLKVGNFSKAIQIARDGLQAFPNEIFLVRTIALAQFRGGDVKAGEETMRPLLDHPRCDWYIKGELAEMEMTLGNDATAFRLLCQALIKKQDDQFKLGYLELFASLSLKMKKPEWSQLTLALARSVRSSAGWNIPASLVALENQTVQAFQSLGKTLPVVAQTKVDLAYPCNQIWKEGASEGLPRFHGKIKKIFPDRKYTFIQPEESGEAPIVFLRDLPRDCSAEGALVEYSLEKSFDAKKNRDSYKAVEIRKIHS